MRQNPCLSSSRQPPQTHGGSTALLPERDEEISVEHVRRLPRRDGKPLAVIKLDLLTLSGAWARSPPPAHCLKRRSSFGIDWFRGKRSHTSRVRWLVRRYREQPRVHGHQFILVHQRCGSNGAVGHDAEHKDAGEKVRS